MENNLKLWQELYGLIDEWIALKPWEYLWSEEFVCIDFPDEDTYYCTIMGRAGNCIGLSIYQGEEGYSDLCSVSMEYEDHEVLKYVMFEQSCLTFYLGEYVEVPDEQKQILSELDKNYLDFYPYFLSYQKRFYPWQLNNNEVKTMIKILYVLIDVIKKYIAGDIDVHLDDEEMIYAHYQKQWVYEAMCLPEEVDKFYPMTLEDEALLVQLSQQPLISQNLYMDLIYLDSFMHDENYERPVNILIFLVVDELSEQIIHAQLVKPDDDVILLILQFMISYLLEYGRMNEIYVRNPSILSAIQSMCEQCQIHVMMNDFSLIDLIVDEIKQKL